MYWDDKYGTHSVSPDVSFMDIISQTRFQLSLLKGRMIIFIAVQTLGNTSDGKFCAVNVSI